MLYFFFVLFFISCFLAWLFKNYAIKKGLLDIPNQRSAHMLPTPCGGGIVFILLWFIYAVSLVALGVWNTSHSLALLPAIFSIAFIGFCDDKFNLRARVRFLVHLLATLYFLFMIGGLSFINYGGFTLHAMWVFSILAFFILIWSINLFNFMDGTDGLAAMEAIFIFFIGGLLLLCKYQAIDLAYLCFSMVAGVAGFLIWNWPKAKIFMGDIGSTCLGFLIIAIGILAQKYYSMSLFFWPMLYGAFIFDATITLIRRVLHREKLYQAHSRHAYQRLYRAGWSHLKILLSAIIVNLFILTWIVLAIYFTKFILIFVLGELMMLSFIYYRVEKIFPMWSER